MNEEDLQSLYNQSQGDESPSTSTICGECKPTEANSCPDDCQCTGTRASTAHFSCYAYNNGRRGMSQDYHKANELYLKVGELGCADAYFNLGNSYALGRGVEVDVKKAKHYHELAAIKGNVNARHNLGSFEYEAGNIQRAKKHMIIAARAGEKDSLDCIKRMGLDEDSLQKMNIQILYELVTRGKMK